MMINNNDKPERTEKEQAIDKLYALYPELKLRLSEYLGRPPTEEELTIVTIAINVVLASQKDMLALVDYILGRKTLPSK